MREIRVCEGCKEKYLAHDKKSKYCTKKCYWNNKKKGGI